jgi:hypothetical protein
MLQQDAAAKPAGHVLRYLFEQFVGLLVWVGTSVCTFASAAMRPTASAQASV